MSFSGLLDHQCRIWRRTESPGTMGQTEVTYAVPIGYEALWCAFTRRKSVLADSGAGLQPVGQRTIYLEEMGLTWQDRDIVEIYEGPSVFVGAMRLELVSVSVPRGHHVEITGQEWDGILPTDTGS